MDTSASSLYAEIKWENELQAKLTSETNQFLGIFPEVVWIRISDQLRYDFDSTRNLVNSSPFFRNLLYKKRVNFLFKDVFTHMAPHLLGDLIIDFPRHGWSNQQGVESLFLRSRLVCRDWNKACESLAEDVNLEFTDMNPESKTFQTSSMIKLAYNFSSTEKLNRFMTRFEHAPRSPFFGRTIMIQTLPFDLEIFDPNYYEKFSLILNRFGDKLLNCRIFLESYEPIVEQVHPRLMEWLNGMPNLQVLLISDNKFTSLGANISGPPPTFKHLKHLTLFSVPVRLCSEILAKNTLVPKITVKPLDDDYGAINLADNFEHLEELDLECNSWNEIRILRDSSVQTLKLKKLKLEFHVTVSGPPMEWSELFDILSSKLGECLEELEMILPEETGEIEKNKILNDSFNCRLNLPKLRKLYLAVRNDTSFDFLLGAANSLVSLQIGRIVLDCKHAKKYGKEYFKAKRNQTLQIWGYEDKLYRSNIWTLFPKLKKVWVRRCTYGLILWDLPTHRDIYRRVNLRHEIDEPRSNSFIQRILNVFK